MLKRYGMQEIIQNTHIRRLSNIYIRVALISAATMIASGFFQINCPQAHSAILKFLPKIIIKVKLLFIYSIAYNQPAMSMLLPF